MQHVPALAELAVRLDARLRADAQVECRVRGGSLDLNAAGSYARDQLDACTSSSNNAA